MTQTRVCNEIVSSNIEQQFQRDLTVGERLSDGLAEFGGRFEIQQIQIELLEELGHKTSRDGADGW